MMLRLSMNHDRDSPHKQSSSKNDTAGGTLKPGPNVKIVLDVRDSNSATTDEMGRSFRLVATPLRLE
jgi:hypothetical protein